MEKGANFQVSVGLKGGLPNEKIFCKTSVTR